MLITEGKEGEIDECCRNMTSASVKYVGQKVSKVRWSPPGHLTPSKTFASGGWDNQVSIYYVSFSNKLYSIIRL